MSKDTSDAKKIFNFEVETLHGGGNVHLELKRTSVLAESLVNEGVYSMIELPLHGIPRWKLQLESLASPGNGNDDDQEMVA